MTSIKSPELAMSASSRWFIIDFVTPFISVSRCQSCYDLWQLQPYKLKRWRRVDGLCKKLCYEMFCFCLLHMQCALLCLVWVASSIKLAMLEFVWLQHTHLYYYKQSEVWAKRLALSYLQPINKKGQHTNLPPDTYYQETPKVPPLNSMPSCCTGISNTQCQARYFLL